MTFFDGREARYFQLPVLKKVIDMSPVVYSGVRKLVQGLDWETVQLPEVTYEKLGYRGNKEKQLIRNYWDENEFGRVKHVLDKRKGKEATSVAMSMRGKAKESRSQGWCLLSIVFSEVQDIRTIEVQYRSNELIRKFGADLVFLKSISERLNFEPNLWRFRFANAYFSGVYFPSLFAFCDPIRCLDYLWEHDRKLFTGGTRFLLRSCAMKEQSFPYAPEQQQHDFAWENLNMKRIKDYLYDKHEKAGSKMPRKYNPVKSR